MSARIRRILDRLLRHTAPDELPGDWPLCPDCWVRFPSQGLLTSHWARSVICGPPGERSGLPL